MKKFRNRDIRLSWGIFSLKEYVVLIWNHTGFAQTLILGIVKQLTKLTFGLNFLKIFMKNDFSQIDPGSFQEASKSSRTSKNITGVVLEGSGATSKNHKKSS